MSRVQIDLQLLVGAAVGLLLSLATGMPWFGAVFQVVFALRWIPRIHPSEPATDRGGA